jgi:hypothetical protein
MDLVKNAKTDEEKYAVIWSVSNLVPLKQFKPNKIKIIYYENLCTQPEIELPAIFACIGQTFRDSKKRGQLSLPSHAYYQRHGGRNG